MKKRIHIHSILPLLALLVGFYLHSCSDKDYISGKVSTFEELKREFMDVPARYRPVPFWVWNERITTTMIDEQLEDFYSHGFGGVFVHPRYGLITEYASDEWYELVSYAARKARKLGIYLWLYDENSFPSGFAGGLVPAEMPSAFKEGHALKMIRQEVLDPDPLKEYLLVYENKDSMSDITDLYLQRIGESGHFLLFEKVFYPVSDWYAGFSYVDLLMPGVTEKFIEVTMTGYEEMIGTVLRKTVPGIFTDEPHIAAEGDGGSIRWTPDLFDEFDTRYHYRLEPLLYDLIVNTDRSYKVRHDYYQLLLDLFIERWSEPWYNYSEEKNLLWTGHYWEHGWPSPAQGPDNMAMYAWHQLPGIDMLFNNWKDRPDQFGNVRAVRELNSAANQLGRKRRLSETYGASGHELTFMDMKRNGDWEFVLGVNLMNQHLSYQSMLGDRKHDFPQTISYHAPYWDEYPLLTDYFGRLSLALSAGEQNNDILIIEPTTSAWMLYSPAGENRKLSEMDRSFSSLLNFMEDVHAEYDLGSERIIFDHGSVEEKKFIIGERGYHTIVLPQKLINLNRRTFDLLKEFMDAGGKVICFGNIEYIDGQKTSLISEWPLQYKDNWIKLPGYDDRRFIPLVTNKYLDFKEQTGPGILHQRRELEKGDLLFLVNPSINETASCRIFAEGKDLVELDLFSGLLKHYPCVVAEKILSFDVTIEPAGSKLLYISDREENVRSQHRQKWKGLDQERIPDTLYIERNGMNVLTLDYCSLVIDRDTLPEMYFYNAQSVIFNHYGFPKNPWVSSSQFKQEIVERDTFPSGSGFQAFFSIYIDSDFKSDDLNLVVERAELYSVYINDKELISDGSWWLDKGFSVFPVKDGILPGENVIRIEADPMSVFCELEPVYLVGDFDVWPLDKGWLLDSPGEAGTGSWRLNGMPFYSGEVTYASEFEWNSDKPVKLIVDEWEGTVIRVQVNGQDAGLIINKPGELRLDQFLSEGKNTIRVIVNGSLKNTLGPHHNISTRGIVTPWSFKYAPEQQPSGNDYDLLDYGLLEPYRILIGK